MRNESIQALVDYAERTGLIDGADRVWAVNRLLEVLHADTYTPPKQAASGSLADILRDLCDCALETGALEQDSVVYRDLFDTKLMGALTPAPSQVQNNFTFLYNQDPKRATDWFYQFSQNTNYIRRDRIAKDVKWIAPTEYGDLDITINLSKPEKDPKAIAAAKLMPQSSYPKCLLCKENEGYAGRVNHPARQNHRVIPVTINGSRWFMQYSPYVYYNEHCIIFNEQHIPMKIDYAVFRKLLDFVRQYPHYMAGSNADLPIVGGSILSHDHFQGGGYVFAMAKADYERKFVIPGFESVTAGIVKWPMSVIRLQGDDMEVMAKAADHILTSWRAYTDADAFIFSETDGVPHNTITPIARMHDDKLELDLVLRNNITTEKCPWGVYHPSADLHHIKKENIGLIEVMGLAVLPARLKGEMAELSKAILAGEDIRKNALIEKHADWVDSWIGNYDITAENITEILHDEISKVFVKVLECAGVYKRTEEGQAAFMRFVDSL